MFMKQQQTQFILLPTLLLLAGLLSGCVSPSKESSASVSSQVVGPPQSPAITLEAGSPEARYRLIAKKLDLASVEGYPQTVTSYQESASGYDLQIDFQRDPERLDKVTHTGDSLPPEVAPYLEPTALIQSDDPSICGMAESLRSPDDDSVAFAAQAAAWTAQNITFDNDLAQKIWNGQVDSQSALDTLQRKKGTCSEYTNLFIALMRCQGIPARFVHGYVYKGMYHAWAEIYLEGIGWHPIDPQVGRGISERHIRLFAGRDFADTNVKLQEIQVRVYELDR
jgi:transglutaminase-like putative cysteine protease